MEGLKKVQVEPSKMEILNDMVTDEIVRALEKDDGEFIEGIVATGQECFNQGVHLLFLYNDWRCPLERKEIKDEETGMYIRIQPAPIWLLEDEKERNRMRSDYSWGAEVKYGTLLYDRSRNIEKLREKLLQEGTNDINYWRGMCEFEPPIQYKIRAKSIF